MAELVPRARESPLPLWERVIASVSERSGEGLASGASMITLQVPIALPLTRFSLALQARTTLSHKGRGEEFLRESKPSARWSCATQDRGAPAARRAARRSD